MAVAVNALLNGRRMAILIDYTARAGVVLIVPVLMGAKARRCWRAGSSPANEFMIMRSTHGNVSSARTVTVLDIEGLRHRAN